MWGSMAPEKSAKIKPKSRTSPQRPPHPTTHSHPHPTTHHPPPTTNSQNQAQAKDTCSGLELDRELLEEGVRLVPEDPRDVSRMPSECKPRSVPDASIPMRKATGHPKLMDG